MQRSTSDQKRAPGRKFITKLVAALGNEWTGSPPRPARQAWVLRCLGLRSAESSGRAKKPCMTVDATATSGVREVATWPPIRQWTDTQVWQRIADRRLPYHWAYKGLMERLSCSLRVPATFEDCVTAVQLRPEIGQIYLALEQEVGRSFRVDFSIAQVVAEAERRGPILWQRGDALRRHLGDAVADEYLSALHSMALTCMDAIGGACIIDALSCPRLASAEPASRSAGQPCMACTTPDLRMRS